jgi:hypothetical protein
VLLAGFGLVGALIHGQLDPHLGLNRQSLVLVGGLAAAFVVVTGLAEALRIPYLRRRGGPPSHLRMFPLALVAAVALVAVSRAFELQPGLIFGITCRLALGGELNDLEEVRSIAVASVGLLVVAVASWLLCTPVADAAGGPDPGTWTLFLDAALSTLWVTGLQAVIFGLLPLRFLYGEKLVKRSPVCWIARALRCSCSCTPWRGRAEDRRVTSPPRRSGRCSDCSGCSRSGRSARGRGSDSSRRLAPSLSWPET